MTTHLLPGGLQNIYVTLPLQPSLKQALCLGTFWNHSPVQYIMEFIFPLSTLSHLKPSFRLKYDLLCVHLWTSHRLLSDCTDCAKLGFYRMTALWCRWRLNKAKTLLCSLYIKIQYMLIHSAKDLTITPLFPSKIWTIWHRKTNSERWKTLTTPSMSVMSGGAIMDWTINLCLLFSFGS